MRVSPEWLWRDFRLRLSRGRNHGSSERLERAALVWGIYRIATLVQPNGGVNASGGIGTLAAVLWRWLGLSQGS